MEFLQRGLNIPLPAEFPRTQLIDICATLTRLPSGTAEGCRAPLEYARNRLPAIRREHIVTEGSAGEDTVLTRGTSLDQKLSTLMTSVSTALDEYRRLAAEETEPEFKPEAGVAASKAKVADVVTQASELEAKLGQAQATINEIAQPGSVGADDLQRQFQDARGLSQLASAEARMPRVVPGWLRKTVVALKRFPDIIRRTMSGLRTGADIAEVWVNRWQEFKHEGIQFLFEQFRKTTKAGERTAEILEAGANGSPSSEPETDTDEATAVVNAIRRREQLQRSVRQSLEELEYNEKLLHQPVLELDAAYDHAVKQRAEHQDKLMAGMKELAHIDRYLSMHRQYTLAADSNADQGFATIVDPTLGVVGGGLTQRVFEQLIRTILREVGRPMQTGEVLDAFAERGLPFGGNNPTKTAWNRMWQAKTHGVVDQIENLGYWLEGVPLPADAAHAVATARSRRGRRKRNRLRPIARNTGNAPGRKRYLSEAEVALARNWFRSGKSLSEVRAILGGITRQTLVAYFPGGMAALREQYPHLAKRKPPSPPKPGAKPPGRRSTLDDTQVAKVKNLHTTGMSVPAIATEMGVSEHVIYRALGGIRKPKA